VVNGRRYNHTDQASPTQFIVPKEPWRHRHHHHRHTPPPAVAVVCSGSIVHPAAATRHRTSVQELVVDAEAPSTKCRLHRRALARKGRPYHNHSRSVASSLPSPTSSPPSPVIYLIVVFLSVIVFSPLPHPVVATPPTASAIVVIVVAATDAVVIVAAVVVVDIVFFVVVAI